MSKENKLIAYDKDGLRYRCLRIQKYDFAGTVPNGCVWYAQDHSAPGSKGNLKGCPTCINRIPDSADTEAFEHANKT